MSSSYKMPEESKPWPFVMVPWLPDEDEPILESDEKEPG